MFNPVIQLLRPVSPLAWFPIWLIVFSDSGRAAIWVIFITSLWPTVLSTAAAAAAVPSDQRAVAKVFQFGKVAYLRHVLVPNSLPVDRHRHAGVDGHRLDGDRGRRDARQRRRRRHRLLRVGAVQRPQPGGDDRAPIVLIGVAGFVLDLVFLRLAKAVAIEEQPS